MYEDNWSFDSNEKSNNVRLSENDTAAHFHSEHAGWSNAAVRGTRVLNNGIFFWEIEVQKIFGTSMMIGVGTKHASLEIDDFFGNLIGRDDHSWGLNHKGFICHNGFDEKFCEPFEKRKAAIVGVLFNGLNGTLEYFLNGTYLGVAFRGINQKSGDLFPVVCSPAYKSVMTLRNTKRRLSNLQERSRLVVTQIVKIRDELETLELPKTVIAFLAESLPR